MHSTTTALHVIHEQISRGLNQKRPCSRTVLAALDLKKAFDTVCISTLLQDIEASDIPYNTKKWLRSYYRGRYTYTEFRGSKSRRRPMKQGVPQGSVISPTLFNLYMSKMPRPPDDVTLVTYADDCTILATGPDVESLCVKINTYLNTLYDWFTTRNLQLSFEKSTVTVFTSWTKEVSTPVSVNINGHLLPNVSNPKLLGITFDQMLTFNAHANAIRTKMKTRNNALKAIAGSDWGKDKETIITTYKAIGRPILNYAAPIWSPQISQTHWTNLQATQNAALRIATGCHLMAAEDHLHMEAKLIPIKPHGEMISKQYLASCHKDDHPCHNAGYKPSIVQLIQQNNNNMTSVDQDTYKTMIKDIHTQAVQQTIENFKPNKVLQKQPPPISENELQLPRKIRTTLAQLRSGYCKLLNNYLNRLDSEIDDVCPKCNEHPHDTMHLFKCTQHPTQLGVEDLWTNPQAVATFLDLED